MSEDSRPDEPRRSGWARRIRRALVALVLAAVALLVVVHLPPVRRALIDFALERLHARLGADITYESISYNLITGTIEIDGLRVGASGQMPLVSARHVSVRYPWSLYRGELDGLDVTLEHGDVALVRESDRWITVPTKWTAPSASTEAPKPLPAFAALRLHDVRVRYEDRDTKFVATTAGVTVDLLPTGSGQPGDLAGELGSGSTTTISLPPRGTTLTIRGGRAKFTPQSTGVDGLRVDAPEGAIAADVAFTFHGTDRLHVGARGDLQGQALGRWESLLDTLRGSLSVAFRIPAAHGAPAFADVAVSGKNLAWQNVAVGSIAATGALDTRGITLSSLRLAVGGGSADGSGRLAWADTGRSNAVLAFRDMDAGRLWRTLLAKSPGALYVAPGSLVSGRFDGAWSAWHAAALDARLQTTWRQRGSGLDRGEHLWLDGRVDARFQRGPWTIDVDARADGALDVRGTIRTRGSPADYARWPLGGSLSLSGPVAPVALDGFRLAGLDARPEFAEAAGTIDGTAELSRTFGEARAALALQSALTWPDQPAVAVDVNATVDPSALTIDSFTARSGPAYASASVLIDFRKDVIGGQYSASRVAVEAWTRRFGFGAPATGLVDVAGRIDGPLKRPLVDAHLQGGPVALASQTVQSVEARVRYGTSVLHLDDVVATGARGGRLSGSASWHVDSGAISGALKAAGLVLDTAVPGLATAADKPAGTLSARLDGDIRVEGTTASPLVTADFRAPSILLDDRSFGPLTATIATTAAQAHVDVRADDLGVQLTGDVGTQGRHEFTGQLAMHSPDSPLAAKLGGVDVSLGAVDLVAHAAGALTGADLRSADLSVDRLDAVVQDLPVAIARGARLSWLPGEVDVSGLDLSSAGTHLTVAGRLDGRPTHGIQARLTGQLQDLRPSLAPYMPAGTEAIVLQGAFNATVTANGSLDSPVVIGSLALDDGVVGDGLRPPVTGIKVRAALDRDRLQLELAEGHWQGAHAAIAGTVPSRFLHVPGASPGGEASLNGHVDDVTIKVLEPFVSAETLKATDFNVKVEYSLTAREPTLDAAVADVRVADASLSSSEMGVSQRSPGHVTVRHGVATLEPWTLVSRTLSTQVTLGGTMALAGERSVNGKVEGQMDLRSLSLVLGSYRPSGRATLSAAVTGPMDRPNVDGFISLEGAELLIRDPRLLFSEIHGTVRFGGGQIAVERFTGTMNGGSLEASGTVGVPGRGKPAGKIAIKVEGALFDVPRGFRSMVDADLTLTGRSQDARFNLAGTATIVEAAYRESLIVTGGLLSLFQSKPTFGATSTRAAGPGPVNLNIQVLANDSITLDTSYGRVSIGTNLRVFGSPSNVRVTGSADIAAGGQIFLGGHTYQIQSARFEFTDPTTLAPDIHLVAQTSVSGYQLTMRIDTVEGRTDTRLSSDPPLPEDQIASLMVSGTRSGSAAPGDVVTQQLASALSGEITTAVGRVVGLDSVRLESGNPGDVMYDPSLISADSNPAQRLTLSKKVLPTLEVIVSQNLRESGQITYIVSWEVVPSLTLRFVQQDNQDRSYEVRHDISFGGGSAIKPVKKRAPETVRDVFVAVFGDVSEAEVRQELEVTAGSQFDFYKWQEDRDRLEKLFLDRGYFQARITARRDPVAPPKNDTKVPTPVDLGYTIDEGPRTSLVVTGIQIPDALRKALIASWSDTPVDALLGDEFSRLLLPWLASKGYLKPTVATDVRMQGSTKVATIVVTPGTRFTKRELVFAGNTHVETSDLNDAVKKSGIGERVWSAPADLQTLLMGEYRKRGYLAAEITVGNAAFEGNRASLPVRVVEGPIFKVGIARVEDPGAAPTGVDLSSPIAPGTILSDQLVRDGTRQMQQRYRLAGYRGTRVTAQSTARSDKTTVDLLFKVTRGERAVLGTLTINGVEGKDRALVERLVPFVPGQPISLDAINTTRDALYDTDLFRQVVIDATPRTTPDGKRQPGVLDATVKLEPLPKYRLQYGFQLFDPYRPAVNPKWGSVDPGVVADVTRRGLFGRGITAGIAGRANPSDRVFRLYMSTQRFLGKPLQTNFYIGDEWERQVNEAGIHAEQSTRDFTFDQRVRRKGIQVAYGYNFQAIDLHITGQPTTADNDKLPEETKGNVSRLLGSIYFDQRDNVIDTTRGFFHSSSEEVGPEWLGSTLAYQKFLNQDFLFIPFPGTVVSASAARVEYASGKGQIFVTSERLRMGGSTTVRGYDDVSLELLTQEALGARTTVVVLNQEIRFPLYRRFRGALFLDHADLIGDVNLPDLTKNRTSTGVGLRFVLPFILLRVDYGYPLKQDSVNDHGRWYFSIGQAF